MGEIIQFTGGQIFFNGEQIVFNCDCCPTECAWCNEGHGPAGDIVRVTFNFNNWPLGPGEGSPECADCEAYGSTAYDLEKVIPGDTKCVWIGPGECEHLIKLEHTDGLDGSFLVLSIRSSDGSTAYAIWRYATSWGSEKFDCDEDDGTLLFSSSLGASPTGFSNPLFGQTARPCLGTGEALVDYLL